MLTGPCISAARQTRALKVSADSRAYQCCINAYQISGRISGLTNGPLMQHCPNVAVWEFRGNIASGYLVGVLTNTDVTEPLLQGEFANAGGHCFNDPLASTPINTASAYTEFSLGETVHWNAHIPNKCQLAPTEIFPALICPIAR